MMSIKRDDIASIRSLDNIVAIFSEKGFTEYKKESDTEIRIKISDEPTFLSVFQINGVADVPRHQKYLDVKTEYLILVTHDFENLIFVKKEFTKLDTERFRKLRINKSKITNTSLNKINGLNFNDVTLFDNLFDRKEVVKQFYDEFIKYRNLLIDNISGLDTEIEKERYAQILVDRLIFLYFIQKKNLLDENENYLSQKLKENRGDFFNNFLCLLFFKGLSIKGFKDRKLGDIPYLNGGLFRQKKCEQVKISIPDEVFETILTFFDSWNWYVDERADFGEEKSISPEILGHIFEKTVNQKESGAYYTPELITSYISETTIYPVCLNKMNSRFKQNYSTIKELFEKDSPEEIAYLYNEVLKKLSVLDNACGSGAFLIAAQDVLIDIYSQTIFRLKSDPVFIEEIKEHNRNHELKLDLNLASAQEFHDNSRWSYYIKRMIITNNLYGVDIEEGAGEIGKLRLWLSMIAHVPENISLVEPLPNIEYNIRCGNSFIGYTSATQIVDEKDLPKKPKKKIVWNTLSGNQISLDTYQPDSIFHLYYDRNQLIRQYKDADDSKKAADLKETIDQKTYEYNQVLNKKLFDEIVFEKGLEITEDSFVDLKPFHWIMEFSDIFERGGFDIIVGNPPYLRIQTLNKCAEEEVEYYKDQYQVAKKGNYDIYVVFVESSIDLLNKNGILGYILPHKFFIAKYGEPLRKFIAGGKLLKKIVHFGHQQVFVGATTYTCLLFLGKSVTDEFCFTKIDSTKIWSITKTAESAILGSEDISEKEWYFVIGPDAIVFKKLIAMPNKLGNLIKLFVGLQTSADPIYILKPLAVNPQYSIVKSKLFENEDIQIETSILHPLLKGAEIIRYEKPGYENVLIFPYYIQSSQAVPINIHEMQSKYSFAVTYLEKNKDALIERPKTSEKNWWLFPYPKNLTLFERPKILCQVLSTRGNFTLDAKGEFYFVGGGTAGGYAIYDEKEDVDYLKFLLGILNSSLTTFFVSKVGSGFQSDFYAFGKSSLEIFPLPKINLKNIDDKKRYFEMISSVTSTLNYHKQLQEIQSENEKIELTKKIIEIEKSIDKLVYDLYGLTVEEIAIIEDGLSRKGKC